MRSMQICIPIMIFLVMLAMLVTIIGGTLSAFYNYESIIIYVQLTLLLIALSIPFTIISLIAAYKQHIISGSYLFFSLILPLCFAGFPYIAVVLILWKDMKNFQSQQIDKSQQESS